MFTLRSITSLSLIPVTMRTGVRRMSFRVDFIFSSKEISLHGDGSTVVLKKTRVPRYQERDVADTSFLAKSIATVVDHDKLCPARHRWNCGLHHGIRALALGVLPAAGLACGMVRELALCGNHLPAKCRGVDWW